MKNCKHGDVSVVKGDRLSMDQCLKNDTKRAEMKDRPFGNALGSLLYA